MNRRSVLALIGGGVASAGCLGTSQNSRDGGGQFEEIKNVAGGAIDNVLGGDGEAGLTQEFGRFSPGFEKIDFERVIASNFNGWLATITFGSHNMDGFGIRHASLDSIEDDIYVCAAPKSTGTREIPIVRVLKEDGAVYPDRRFNLVAYEGEFSDCGQRFQFNVSMETKGTATFTLPRVVAPPSSFRDMTPTPAPSN